MNAALEKAAFFLVYTFFEVIILFLKAYLKKM